MKKVWISFGVAIGLLLLLCGVLMVTFYVETRKMSSLETQMVVKGVYSVQDSYVNLFLIKSGNQYVAIDAGNTAEHIKQELIRLQIDPQNVAAVFLTHTDVYHIAGLSLFHNSVKGVSTSLA